MMDIQPKVFKSNYEMNFIVSPELSEADYKKVVGKFVDMVKKADGEVTNIENWGVRKLAYPISRKTNGYYAYVEFTTYGDFIQKLEKEFKYDENVLRYLTVRLNKHAFAYNNKRREQGFGMRQNMGK